MGAMSNYVNIPDSNPINNVGYYNQNGQLVNQPRVNVTQPQQPLTRPSTFGVTSGIAGGLLTTASTTVATPAVATMILGDLFADFGKDLYYDRMPWLRPESPYNSREEWEAATGQTQTDGGQTQQNQNAPRPAPDLPPEGNLLTVLSQNGFNLVGVLNDISLSSKKQLELSLMMVQSLMQMNQTMQGSMEVSAVQNYDILQQMQNQMQISAIQNADLMQLMTENNNAVVQQMQDSLQVTAIQNADMVEALQNQDFTTPLTQDELDLIVLKKQQIEEDLTPVEIKDLDGNTVATMSPSKAKASQAISQARKDTDTNNFELDNDDYDMFSMPDITGIFTPESKTDRLSTVVTP